MGQPMMILIAGPYRSGTGDDPEKISQNVRAMESYALPIFRLGHIPLLGEWFALRWFRLPVQNGSGMRRSMKFFTPLRNACWKNAMRS